MADLGESLAFGILGPLEVWRHGRPVAVGGVRQRALLALLIIQANELVTTDQLVDGLFDGEASDGAVNAVQQAVSRLRRSLGRDGSNGAVLLTRSGGYVLRVAADGVDALIFERLLAEGRQLLAGGDTQAAARRLSQALGLWRGPALGDLSGLSALQLEISRLEELRLLGTMERIDAELRLGGHAQLIPELESVCAANPLVERLHEQHALALYRAGRQADALAVCRRAGDRLRDELGLELSSALRALHQRMLLHDRALDHYERSGSAPGSPIICPFKGLAAYERSDADFFGGRDRLVSDLVARLAASRLVGIVGASGIGKSSLVRAGVLAALAAGALPESSGWPQVVIRPRAHPVRELARRLQAEAVTAAPEGERVVVVVDQLEELFVLCEDEGERATFVEQLVAGACDAGRQLVVVVALRADYYGRIASYPRFAEMLSANHVLVGPMTRRELAEAIELPAARAGLEVEPALLDRLVADLAGEPGALPLLSTMLLELWRVRDGPILRAQTYDLRGGVFAAVLRLAEDAFGRLDESDQHVARRLLLRLANDDGGLVTRRRLPLAELDGLAGATRVLTVLTEARLLTVGDGEVEVSHEALLHEWPRYRGWLDEDRVGRRVAAHLAASAHEWDAHGRDAADLYRGTRLAAAEERAKRHPDDLGPRERAFLRASRIATERAFRMLRFRLAALAVLLVLAVCAGVLALVQGRHAGTEARLATARQLGAEAVVEPRIDLAMLLAREAFRLDRSPATESTLLATLLRSPAAIASFTLPLGVRPLALALSPDGHRLVVDANNDRLYSYAPGGRQAEPMPMVGAYADPGPLYSTDGSLLVVADSRLPAFDVLDARTFGLQTRLPLDPRWRTAPVIDGMGQSLVIAPDRRTVYYAYSTLSPAGAAGPGYLDRWTLPSGRLLSSTRVTDGFVAALQLVDGGKRLVLFGGSQTRVLDAATGAPRGEKRLTVPVQPGAHAAISSDGTTATVGNRDGSVSLVDLRTGRVRRATGGHTAAVQNVSYSPSGRVVVTTGDDGRVIVWDPMTAAPVQQLLGHDGRVTGIAFASDGHTLYTSALDGTVLEWELGSTRRFGRRFTVGAPRPPAAATGLAPLMPPLAIAPDGKQFAVRIDPGRVGIFSVSTLHEDTSFTVPHRISVTALAWSPTSPELAVGGDHGMLSLWQVRGPPRELRELLSGPLRAHTSEAVQSVTFSADGRLLGVGVAIASTAASPRGRVIVWRMPDARVQSRSASVTAVPNDVAFSADGRLLAMALADGRVIVADAKTGRPRHTLHPVQGDNGGTTSLAFGPSGTLAVGDYAGILQTWNPISGAPLGRPVLANPSPIASIDFNPSGTRIATTGGPGGGLDLWFVSSLQQVGATLDPESGSWGNAGFTPDGRTLISVTTNGDGSAWPVDPASWAAHACAVAGRNFTQAEWTHFVSDYRYTKVCP